MIVDPAPIPSVSPPVRTSASGSGCASRSRCWRALRLPAPSAVCTRASRHTSPTCRRNWGRRWLASGRRADQRLDLWRARQRGHVRALPGPLGVDQRCVQLRVRIQRLPVLRLAYECVRRRGARLVRRRAVAHIRGRRRPLGANSRERAGRLAHGRQRRWAQHQTTTLWQSRDAVSWERLGALPEGMTGGSMTLAGSQAGYVLLSDRQRRLGRLVLGDALDRAIDRAAAPGDGMRLAATPLGFTPGPQRPRHRG